MRIKLLLSASDKPLPINNQDIVNSFIHRALGKNNMYHNTKNDYSVSQLMGGNIIKGTNTISFENGGFIIISSLDEGFFNSILISIYTTPFYGDISVVGMEFIDEQFYNGWNHFATLSPFIIKRYNSKKEYKFLVLDDPNFEDEVKNYLINKLTKINPSLDLSDFEVKISNNQNNKVKKILVKNVINFANKCQLSINCNKKVAELLYNIGIGQSTGSGFGTIYKTENHKIYKYNLKNATNH
jgi:CRISPR-associated endoribonuclease Cas6